MSNMEKAEMKCKCTIKSRQWPATAWQGDYVVCVWDRSLILSDMKSLGMWSSYRWVSCFQAKPSMMSNCLILDGYCTFPAPPCQPGCMAPPVLWGRCVSMNWSAQCTATCLMEETLPPGAIMEPSRVYCTLFISSPLQRLSNLCLHDSISLYPLSFSFPWWEPFTLLCDLRLGSSTVVTGTVQTPSHLK